MVNERYGQPFFVGFGKQSKRFRHQSADGYLEALEPRIDQDEPKETVVVHRTSSMSAQEARVLDQLVKRVDWLQKKLEEKEKRTQEKDQDHY